MSTVVSGESNDRVVCVWCLVWMERAAWKRGPLETWTDWRGSGQLGRPCTQKERKGPVQLKVRCGANGKMVAFGVR